MNNKDILTSTLSAYLMMKVREKLLPSYLVRKANKVTEEIELFRHNYRIKPRFIRLPYHRVIDAEKLSFMIETDYSCIQGRRYFNVSCDDVYYDEAIKLYTDYINVVGQIERFLGIFYRGSLPDIFENHTKNILEDINNDPEYQKIIDEFNGMEILENA